MRSARSRPLPEITALQVFAQGVLACVSTTMDVVADACFISGALRCRPRYAGFRVEADVSNPEVTRRKVADLFILRQNLRSGLGMRYASRTDIYVLAVTVVKGEYHITEHFIAAHSILDALHTIGVLSIRIAAGAAIMVADDCVRCAAAPVYRRQSDRCVQGVRQSDRHRVKSVAVQIHSTGRIIEGLDFEDFGAGGVAVHGGAAAVDIDSAIVIRAISDRDVASDQQVLRLRRCDREVGQLLTALDSCGILQIIARSACILFLTGFHSALDGVKKDLPRDPFTACALIASALLGVVCNQAVVRLVACRNEIIYASQKPILTHATKEL